MIKNGFIIIIYRKKKSAGERIILDFKSSRGPVTVEPRRSDTLRDDAKHLPAMPKSEPTERKSNGSKNGGKKEKSSKQSSIDSKSSRQSSVDSKLSKVSSVDSKQKKSSLDPNKYAHLPVYDKEEEKRKAKERQKKMSEIFSGKI